MSFVVFTCDQYMSLIKSFSYFFNKYWDSEQEVNVLGFKEPDFVLPPNFNFISGGSQEDFAPKDFCGPFRQIIKDLPGSTLTYFLDDTFLISPYHKEVFDEATRLVEATEAHKVQLFWGGHEQFKSSLPFKEGFRQFPQHMDYRCNLAPSVVNKDYFLQYFTPGMNVWDYEIKNMEKARNDGATILVGWKEPIVSWFNVIRHGRFNFQQWEKIEKSDMNSFGWNKYQFLTEEDRAKIYELRDWQAG